MQADSRLGHRVTRVAGLVLFTVVALGFAALLLLPHLPNEAVLRSESTNRDATEFAPSDEVLLITDMPEDAAESFVRRADEKHAIDVRAIPATGAVTGDRRLGESLASARPGASGVDHVVLWVGWGDAWSDRNGLRAAVRDAAEEARDAFPQASVSVIGPLPLAGATSPAFGGMDVTLARAARESAVTYISPLAERWDVAVAESGARPAQGQVLADALLGWTPPVAGGDQPEAAAP